MQCRVILPGKAKEFIYSVCSSVCDVYYANFFIIVVQKGSLMSHQPLRGESKSLLLKKTAAERMFVSSTEVLMILSHRNTFNDVFVRWILLIGSKWPFSEGFSSYAELIECLHTGHASHRRTCCCCCASVLF